METRIQKESTKSWLAKCLLAFAITFTIFSLKFPHYVSAPNDQTFLPNGDLLVTLYDMVYHVRYDESGTFSGMNYPDGEYLFMTDANGSFATVMRWIDNHILDIDNHVPGILLTFIYLLIGVCGMFLFMVLRSSGISTILALLLAPLITFLSPQMVRIACHLSLSFPFVIPMVMLWTLRKFKVPRIEWTDIIFVLVTFFFFMNNAYIGFIMCMFAGLVGFFLWLKDRKIGAHKTAALIMMTTPILITIIVYILLKVNDPYSDRIEEQWGFFHYHTKISSMFTPRFSLAASWMSKYAKGDQRSIEWTNNLGLIPIGLILSYFVFTLTRKFNRSLKPLLSRTTMMSAFWWASFVMFIFAANTAIIPIQEWVEPYLGPLLMFKSSGRFSWPLYFVVALFAAKVLQAWGDRLEMKKRFSSWLLIVPLLLFYTYEVNYYLSNRYDGKESTNYLTSQDAKKIRTDLDSLGINREHYQAMFVLPLFEGWNEKIRAGVFDRSEMGALQISSLTGIPMINGRLSRNSTLKTLQATQMSGHPLLKKEIIDLFPNNKPIILIQGRPIGNRLSFGEQNLKKLAKEVYHTEKYFVFELSLDAIRAEHEKWIAEAKTEFQSEIQEDSLKTNSIVRRHYDETKTEVALFGQGAYMLKAGKERIIDYNVKLDSPDTLTFYSWSEINNKKYGMSEFSISVKGENKYFYQHNLITREERDIYKNWIRAEHTFAVPKGKIQVEVIAKVNQDFWIDEVNLIRSGDNVFHPYLDEDYFLKNGYPIR